MKYYKSTLIAAFIGLSLAYFIAGPTGLFIAAILAVLEVSLSFDNAIVNAIELEKMEDKWKKRFLTWGMLIAVFGMRILFPLVIVGVVAEISPWAALHMAIFEPDVYKTTIQSAHVTVMGFGGSFLYMVFLKFFLNGSKDVHWLNAIEDKLTRIGIIDTIEAGITLLFSIFVSNYLESTHGLQAAHSFLVSSVLGIVTYIAVDGLRLFLQDSEADEAVNVATKTGFASFMYLEILDSSFSFDGVIGAFAITNSLFIIAIGLGIGAYAVRSMTIMLVDKGTLNEYRYLEHGAFWAIGCLASIMFVNTFYEIPEVVTGGLGITFILLALYSSIKQNKLEN